MKATSVPYSGSRCQSDETARCLCSIHSFISKYLSSAYCVPRNCSSPLGYIVNKMEKKNPFSHGVYILVDETGNK